MSSVSVIIVHWNGHHLLTACLDSLRVQTRPADEIVVVDNGSSDGSQAVIRQRYPEVTFIELGENKGFSIANNVGMRQARGDYIALLNNDVRLHPEWMVHMVAALDANPSLGSCACKMLFYDRPDTIDAAGITVWTTGAGGSRGSHERDAEPFQLRAAVFGPCAGAALYRASMLREIGLFDEDLYIYCEDIDLAFRAQLAGYDCMYIPEALAYHHHSASGRCFGKKYYYLARNNLLVLVKDMPTTLIRRHVLRIMVGQVWFALYMAMSGQGREYRQARIDALRLLPRMLRKRWTIQSGARRSPEEIATQLTSARHVTNVT